MSNLAEQSYLIDNIDGLNKNNFTKVESTLSLVSKSNEVDFTGRPVEHRYGVPIESKIKTSEVDEVLVVITENFPDSEFQNKDLSPLIKTLTARQIPSRLKKLIESGELVDCGGSPKKYKLA